MVHIPTYRWAGAAGAGAIADYADIKMQPLSSSLTNSEVVAGGLVLADLFGLGRGHRTGEAVDGGADWAIGALTQGLVRRHLTATAPVVVKTVPTVTTTTTHHTTTSQAGLHGVPASGGSAAFDPVTGGF